MAYHFANEDLSAVKGIDELDSCAYTVLAALFSAVEPNLLERQRRTRQGTAQKKQKELEKVRVGLAALAGKELYKEDTLGEVLKQFGFAGKKVNDVISRVEGNAKLNHFWQAAVKSKEFAKDCALLIAHLDLADMPGNQCTAVVRQERKLYVTGNGLWSSGEQLEQGEGSDLAADKPWFSSATECERTLVALAGSIRAEYSLDEVIFAIPMKGDMKGKFHAEMQLLEYMLDNKILPERGFIGVSKPCCTFCQTNLNAAGLHFWTGHGLRGEDPNDKVEAPYTSYKDPTTVAAFKLAVEKVPFYGLHG